MERVQIQTAGDFWDQRIRNLRFYHGTSLHLETSIRQHGLSPIHRPFSTDDILFLDHVLQRFGFDYLAANIGSIYLSITSSGSQTFLQKGSETIHDIVIPEAQKLLEEPLYADQISTFEKEQIKKILNWSRQFMQEHKPLLLVIPGRTGYMKEFLSDHFPEQSVYLNSRDAFVDRAVANWKDSENMTEYGAAYSLYDYIEGELYDFPIDFTIPSSDITFIKGKRLARI